MRRSTFCTWLVATTAAPLATAQPSQRPISIVVPYAAGGGYDRIARMFATKLGEALRQTVIVENRGGAGGTLGMGAVANAAPDGHTLVMAGPGDIAIAPSIYTKLSYNTSRDFVPISMLARFSLVLLVNPDLQARSVSELVQLAKTRRDPLKCAISSVGSTGHLCAEIFRGATGAPLTIIPYKGTSPALTDLAGGHVEMMFTEPGSGLPFIRSNKLRPLAVTTPSRASALPEVPTMAESGFPSVLVSGWWGLFAPAGTPASFVQQVSRQVSAILKDPEVLKDIQALNAEPSGQFGEEFARVVQADIATYGRAARSANIKLD